MIVLWLRDDHGEPGIGEGSFSSYRREPFFFVGSIKGGWGSIKKFLYWGCFSLISSLGLTEGSGPERIALSSAMMNSISERVNFEQIQITKRDNRLLLIVDFFCKVKRTKKGGDQEIPCIYIKINTLK